MTKISNVTITETVAEASPESDSVAGLTTVCELTVSSGPKVASVGVGGKIEDQKGTSIFSSSSRLKGLFCSGYLESPSVPSTMDF
eukprot:CAMPEP_0170454404 /NCGR_PEP_ID=MMETSP0123-20130129/2665_1 /TAXON_ID=182087 /ORGANISM="Favella ehrenbergii, Strain Fehren 1" /LENGTH=84 /DNA_ID=CAMNT_0010717101 /DNA_START=141 /DNA_END=395 /DNA_ORIENTATION=+